MYIHADKNYLRKSAYAEGKDLRVSASILLNMINLYQFGKIIINNKEYFNDVIIYPDIDSGNIKVLSPFWRREGHYLDMSDVPDEILSIKIDVVVVGTGYSGLMKVSEKFKNYFKNKGVEVVIENSKKAWKIYNKLEKDKKVMAIFHLTC